MVDWERMRNRRGDAEGLLTFANSEWLIQPMWRRVETLSVLEYKAGRGYSSKGQAAVPQVSEEVANSLLAGRSFSRLAWLALLVGQRANRKKWEICVLDPFSLSFPFLSTRSWVLEQGEKRKIKR